MKPREWWAVLETEEDGDEEYSSGAICSDGGGNLYWQDNQFKVIEKSAYDRLEAMCEKIGSAAVKLGIVKDLYNPDYIPSVRDLIDAEDEFRKILEEYRAYQKEKK